VAGGERTVPAWGSAILPPMIDRVVLRNGLRRGAGWLLASLLWAWSAGAILFSPYSTAPLRVVLALLFLVALPLAYRWAIRRYPRPAVMAGVFAFGSVPLVAWLVLLRPSNERDWNADQQRLATARIDGDRVTLANVRNFSYRSTSDFEPHWEDRSYDLGRIESLWFVVEPFSGFPGAAHTFLSFGFEGGEYLAVSAEIRKEHGESFSPWKGLYRNYELMYVFGDERDLVQLRTGHRKDTVYVYPLRASKEQVRATFLDMLDRANALVARPEFYNTLTNTCTTNIVHHANRIQAGLVPLSWRLWLPGHSDALALQLGLIDFDGSLEQARATFRVNERAALAADAADFSVRIRSH
jgi:hypothetical protein